MTARLTTVVTTTIVIGAIATGCGSGSDSGSSSASTAARTASLSKAEFVEQANAACEQERSGLAARVSTFERGRKGRKSEPGADMVHFVYLPTMEAQIWRIEELGVPKGEEARIDAMLDAERFGVDAVAVKSRVPSIAAAEREFLKADRLFQASGLYACTTEGKKKGPG